jgi:thiamine-phosphate pyrophosphorylase
MFSNSNIVMSYHLMLHSEIDVVTELFRSGLSLFHLRKHDFSQYDYRCYLELLPAEYLGRVVLHSNYELVAEYGLGGCYVPSSKRIGSVLPCGDMLLSTFASNFSELDAIDGNYNYVIMGPAFKSISKPGLAAPFDLEAARQNLSGRPHRFKIVAIGGIKEDTFRLALNMGFDGAAILGSLWSEYIRTFDIGATVRKYERIRNVALVMGN